MERSCKSIGKWKNTEEITTGQKMSEKILKLAKINYKLRTILTKL